MQFRPITPQDRTRNIVILAVFLGLVFLMLVAVVVFQKTYLAMILIAFCLVSSIALSKWAVDTYGYKCPSCKHQFEITLRMALLTPHIGDKKLLRCPACGKRDWANAVIKIHQPQ
ncbi:MAG: hypothetical protein QME74_02075 [Candidatus Edwardsbacteria bacterium]|nr:hypothetical protein [Candidatus Edwardsbacteria bacterium]